MSQRLAECCCITQTGGGGGCDACPKWPSAFSAQIQISGAFSINGTAIPFSFTTSTVMQVGRCPDGSGDRCSFASRLLMSHPVNELFSCTRLPYKGALPLKTADSGLIATFPGYQELAGIGVFGCTFAGPRNASRSTYEVLVATGFISQLVGPGYSISTRQFAATGNASDNDTEVSLSCVLSDTERLDSNDIHGNCWHGLGTAFNFNGAVCTSTLLKDPCELPNGVYLGSDVNGWNYTVTIS